MTDMTVAELKAKLTELEIPFKAKDTKSVLEALLEQATKQDGVYVTEIKTGADKSEPAKVVPNRAALRKASFRTPKPKVTVTGKVMDLHYKGRALGLKYYQAMGLAIGRTSQPVNRGGAPKPNNERVQKYARQNGTLTLTPKQMRRVQKSTNKHGETLSYALVGTHVSPTPEQGYSLLAHTPNGLGIFYQFATV